MAAAGAAAVAAVVAAAVAAAAAAALGLSCLHRLHWCECHSRLAR